MALTIESVRNALGRIGDVPGLAEDAVIVREWIAHQAAIIESQAQKILELKEREDALSSPPDD